MPVARGPSVEGLLRCNFRVFEAESPDGDAALIREERVGDAVAIGKTGQGADRVVAQREDGVAGGFELRQALLQLDELRPTVRSPIGAAVEGDQRSAVGPCCVQVDRLAVLVRQHHIGEPFAHGWADSLG